jgi:sorbitol/mannitol transport system substrate-binding protein
MRPTLTRPERNAAVTMYVNLLNNYGPPGSEGNSFNDPRAVQRRQCGLWIDATIAASFLEVDGVAYAQSPNAGNPVGANWLWAWAMAVPTGSPNPKLHTTLSSGQPEYIQASAATRTSVVLFQQVHVHPHMIPEFLAAAPFAAALACSDRFCGTRCAYHTYCSSVRSDP